MTHLLLVCIYYYKYILLKMNITYLNKITIKKNFRKNIKKLVN